ncbi:hypothetical protein C0J52_03730, partial [Blattella germanica]
RSPDLSVCHYYLSGNLKSRVYIEKPRTLEDLAEAITREVREISLAILDDVWTIWTIYPHACNNSWTRTATTWMMSFSHLNCNALLLCFMFIK